MFRIEKISNSRGPDGRGEGTGVLWENRTFPTLNKCLSEFRRIDGLDALDNWSIQFLYINEWVRICVWDWSANDPEILEAIDRLA